MEFPYISFSKGKEFNNEFDDLHSNVWLFFHIIWSRKVSMEKKQEQAKMWFYGKAFSYKAGVLF